MTKELFPAWCRHFVTNLPKGMGKGGKSVILIFDGHASRWNYDGLKYLLENNVFCLCLPGHTSIWAQPNDCGPNSSLKSRLGDSVARFRSSHRGIPGCERLMRFTRPDFNQIFVEAWRTFADRSQRELEETGTNAIKSGWMRTGLCPYNRRPPNWEAAIARFGYREELATATETPRGSDAVLPGADADELQKMFAAALAKRAAAAAPSAPESLHTTHKAGAAPVGTPSTARAPATPAGAASAATLSTLTAQLQLPPPNGVTTPPTGGPRPLSSAIQAGAAPMDTASTAGAPVSAAGAASVTVGALAASAPETTVTAQVHRGATTAAPTVPEPLPAASQAGVAPNAEPSTAGAPAASPTAALQAEQANFARDEQCCRGRGGGDSCSCA